MARKYSPGASKDVEREMHKFKRGTLKSGKGGKGGKVKSRKQAIAIGLSEARREGKRVPAGPVRRPSKVARSRAAKKKPHVRESATAQDHKDNFGCQSGRGSSSPLFGRHRHSLGPPPAIKLSLMACPGASCLACRC